MNLTHLKYVVEVDKTRSISKAAENLFMGQPNLSRSIKELEESLNIKIFKRNSKGIEPTIQGEEFLIYAKKIMKDIAEVEFLYSKESHSGIEKFSISLPRASYASNAFNNFITMIDKSIGIDFNYKETNAMRVLKNVELDGFNLGILRYQAKFEDYFLGILKEKHMKHKKLASFNYVLLMSKDSPLNKHKTIKLEQLKPYMEIIHGDPYVPSLSVTEAKKAEFSGLTNKNIYIYERGSQLEMLEKNIDAFMWVSPIPLDVLEKYNLVQRSCIEYNKPYNDILIYNDSYKFTDLDKLFLEQLEISIEQINKLKF